MPGSQNTATRNQPRGQSKSHSAGGGRIGGRVVRVYPECHTLGGRPHEPGGVGTGDPGVSDGQWNFSPKRLQQPSWYPESGIGDVEREVSEQGHAEGFRAEGTSHWRFPNRSETLLEQSFPVHPMPSPAAVSTNTSQLTIPP